ncbi:unnamed protein product [Owenia fusiformis]|uniref:Uncharacterized protein n=1 Tax=Owenia fusiformis TaxID=6347 RepID=A0A8J1UJ17_OWEFU|nr:unnamed protein product [Owenia fusiformis]
MSTLETSHKHHTLANYNTQDPASNMHNTSKEIKHQNTSFSCDTFSEDFEKNNDMEFQDKQESVENGHNNNKSESGDINEEFDEESESQIDVGMDTEMKHSAPEINTNKKTEDMNSELSLQERAFRHHLEMRRESPLSPETSRLLREILQGKEKHFQERIANGEIPSSDSALISKFLQQENRLLQNGNDVENDDVSLQSVSPAETSSDESDQENSQPKLMTNCSVDYSKANGQSGNTDQIVSHDSIKIKGERVDNIISSLSRISPSRALSDMAGNQVEGRSRKRKSYIPQQHDASGTDSSGNKYCKTEKDFLRVQLKDMQKQLKTMQKKYVDLYENASTDQSELSDYDTEKTKLDNFRNGERKVLNSSPFMNQATKIVKETDRKINLAMLSEKPDLQKFAHLLKSEIASSIGSVVDNIVSKFVEKQQHVEEMKKKVQEEKEKVQQEQKSPLQRPGLSPVGPVGPHSHPIFQPHKLLSPHQPPHLNFKSSNAQMSDTMTHNAIKSKVAEKVHSRVTDSQPQSENNLSIRVPSFDHARFESRFREREGLPPHHIPPHSLHSAFPGFPYFPSTHHLPPTQIPMLPPPYNKDIEQTEPISLVMNTPKRKRTKVTDTRLSPRAARQLLSEPNGNGSIRDLNREFGMMHKEMKEELQKRDGFYPSMGLNLPTSVAIPNPGLMHSDVLAMYSQRGPGSAFSERPPSSHHSPPTGENGSPHIARVPCDQSPFQMREMSSLSREDNNSSPSEGSYYDGCQTITLTPMHLRKAKLMFFYSRYPSSAILKVYFPDVKFNKNNTAQLVKWFSNFREFYYIQMEKYARQALAEGVKNAEDLIVTTDSELYRVLNLHYNRNNQIEVPDNFRLVNQATLREFFKSIQQGKDMEQSWKKQIYKIIARLDDTLPEYFKSPNWMDQLADM